MIWKLFNFFSEKYPVHQAHKAFVVLGFQRSGTSLVGQILSKLGVHFGEGDDMKKIDFRNPKGFFENEKIFNILRQMLSQAKIKDEFGVVSSLEAKGAIGRVRRAVSRIKLQKELSLLSKHDSWAVKSFPVLFYYLKPYLPKTTKIIAIYRHPFVVATSFMKAWAGGRYSFYQVVELWSKANRDMLHHIQDTESLLICYEDLFIAEKSENILLKIKDFVGSNISIGELQQVLDPGLNRSSKKVTTSSENYILSDEVKKTLDTLERLKI